MTQGWQDSDDALVKIREAQLFANAKCEDMAIISSSNQLIVIPLKDCTSAPIEVFKYVPKHKVTERVASRKRNGTIVFQEI